MTIDETQKKLSSRLRTGEFLQELDGRAEDERQIIRLRRDASATVADIIECCRSWEPDACILGNVRAGDAVSAFNNLLESADELKKLQEHNADIAVSLQEFLYRVSGVVPFDDAEWVRDLGEEILKQLKQGPK